MGHLGERTMQTVGDYLKNERETKKLSVQEVSQITKISGFYITCLEKGDYDKLPNDTWGRADTWVLGGYLAWYLGTWYLALYLRTCRTCVLGDLRTWRTWDVLVVLGVVVLGTSYLGTGPYLAPYLCRTSVLGVLPYLGTGQTNQL